MTSFTRIGRTFLCAQRTGYAAAAADAGNYRSFLVFNLFYLMPTFTDVNKNALQPYMNGEITREQALDQAEQPLRAFMFKQTREKDLQLFVEMSKIERPQTYNDIRPMF
jgi:flagellar biosynthesis protein FliP